MTVGNDWTRRKGEVAAVVAASMPSVSKIVAPGAQDVVRERGDAVAGRELRASFLRWQL